MSDNPISRPRAMSDEQVQQILDAIKNRGGNITYQDSRLTNIYNVASTIIGLLIVGSITWGIGSINDLNRNVSILITQHTEDARRMDDMAERIKVLEARRDARN